MLFLLQFLSIINIARTSIRVLTKAVGPTYSTRHEAILQNQMRRVAIHVHGASLPSFSYLNRGEGDNPSHGGSNTMATGSLLMEAFFCCRAEATMLQRENRTK